MSNAFEDAWADVYWTFANTFDYRDRSYRERYLGVKAGIIDFDAMTIETE